MRKRKRVSALFLFVLHILFRSRRELATKKLTQDIFAVYCGSSGGREKNFCAFFRVKALFSSKCEGSLRRRQRRRIFHSRLFRKRRPAGIERAKRQTCRLLCGRNFPLPSAKRSRAFAPAVLWPLPAGPVYTFFLLRFEKCGRWQQGPRRRRRAAVRQKL